MLLVVLALLLAPPAAARWSWPAEGPVVRSFTYDATAPFERGARRGITIGAPRGSPIQAACAGRVRFAGTAGANGRAVTVDCGAYATTYLTLSSIAVREGARVGRGARLGTVGGDGLRFGVRRRADRFAYVDPLAFLRRNRRHDRSHRWAGPRAASPSAARHPPRRSERRRSRSSHLGRLRRPGERQPCPSSSGSGSAPRHAASSVRR